MEPSLELQPAPDVTASTEESSGCDDAIVPLIESPIGTSLPVTISNLSLNTLEQSDSGETNHYSGDSDDVVMCEATTHVRFL
jgi:hypothetical protein